MITLDQELNEVLSRIEPEPAKRGPRGGHLDNGTQAARCAALSAPILPNGEIGLHRFKDTAVTGRLNEQPWHAMAAALVVEGKSNKQIAELAEVSEATIAQLKATRWFQEKIALLTNNITGPRLQRFAAEADASIDKLVALRDSENEKVALSAAIYLTNQAFGMPVQKTLSITSNQPFANEREEYDKLQEEIEALRAAQRKPTSAVSTDVDQSQTT